MKRISVLIAAGSLMAAAQQASACPGKPHGYGDGCPPKGGSYVQQMDKNGDGAVSRKEFDAFHAERFKEMDANKDGKIDSKELDATRDEMRDNVRSSMHMSIEQHFDAADTDKDGALTKEEAKQGMPILYDRFDENDANKDGKITKDEVMRDARPRLHPMQGKP
mgnify:CR=1 FL=1